MTTTPKLVIITADGACLGNGQAQVRTRAAAAAILNYQGHRRVVANLSAKAQINVPKSLQSLLLSNTSKGPAPS